MTKLREFSRDSIIYGTGSVLSKVIGLLLIPLYTRYLSPAEFGVLDSINTVTFFMSVLAGLGLGTATTRYFFIAENQDQKGRILFTSLIIQLISYGLIVMIGIILSNKISLWLFKDPKYQPVVIFSILTTLLVSISRQLENIYRYYQKAYKYQFVIILRTIINPLLCVLFLVAFRMGVFGIQLGMFGTTGIVLIFAWFFFSGRKFVPVFDKDWAIKMLKFGYPLIFFSIGLWIFSASDRFFILHYREITEVGLYSIGFKFSQPIIMINMALEMSTGVILLSTYQEDRDSGKKETARLNSLIWNIYICIGVPVAVFLSIFGVQLLKIFTRTEYIPGAIVIPFITFSLILQRSIDITGFGMVLKEKSKPITIIMLITALINILLNFYFIPKYGYKGAALTTLLSYIIYFGLAYYYSQRHFYVKRKVFEKFMGQTIHKK